MGIKWKEGRTFHQSGWPGYLHEPLRVSGRSYGGWQELGGGVGGRQIKSFDPRKLKQTPVCRQGTWLLDSWSLFSICWFDYRMSNLIFLFTISTWRHWPTDLGALFTSGFNAEGGVYRHAPQFRKVDSPVCSRLFNGMNQGWVPSRDGHF